eukprot:522293-Prymnesium_polylepis.1
MDMGMGMVTWAWWHGHGHGHGGMGISAWGEWPSPLVEEEAVGRLEVGDERAARDEEDGGHAGHVTDWVGLPPRGGGRRRAGAARRARRCRAGVQTSGERASSLEQGCWSSAGWSRAGWIGAGRGR